MNLNISGTMVVFAKEVFTLVFHKVTILEMQLPDWNLLLIKDEGSGLHLIL